MSSLLENLALLSYLKIPSFYSPSPKLLISHSCSFMDASQLALQALIEETEALGWDYSEQLDVIEDNPPD